ncbi:hypothetical protein SEA_MEGANTHEEKILLA_171 [Streptomyces phage MeganTheeKilla]|uniref:Uncharacterized protein n=2 Tax=Gilsonvirus gilson TaxID=2846398 RepID=A0A3Q9R4Y6_9CAUD|nr:hypothetical protein HWB98_gp106 [Streptomyces phage Gilson]AZU97223.1 hypothetical protein SEA_GILSON_171 [Streptomyces phage Gilson]QQV92515.1 hypothetical protein SEA_MEGANTHEEKILLA_171 [Streptomyces phage MeganTheeKilla]
MTVAELIAKLQTYHNQDAKVKVLVDDGCGCCSSGGTYEDIDVDVVDGEIRIS